MLRCEEGSASGEVLCSGMGFFRARSARVTGVFGAACRSDGCEQRRAPLGQGVRGALRVEAQYQSVACEWPHALHGVPYAASM
ncbi:hypothetical protein GCM10009807_29210 [Microbacterium lacus]|uniref:Uncharacterized protein n=1 Tax=Microbacterium lacus TaxID=415217 RepID=A0ABN2H8K7_9MICO